MPSPTETFYRDLSPFSEFSGVGDTRAYVRLPDDWVILAADIVRSRDAIAAGRYKEVNVIGAAVIAAVLNALGRDSVPFVFGGDGAMLLVPGSQIEEGRRALAGVASLAREETGLALRIAAIPVAHVRAQGADVRLRKYELSAENHLAMVIGGGLELADRLLKDDDLGQPFRIEIDEDVVPNLEGLSCRWEPLPSERGRVLSLILKPGSGEEDLQAIRQDIQRIVGFDPFGETREANHVRRSKLRFRFPPSGFALEVRLLSRAGQRFGRATGILFECLAVLWGTATGLRFGPFRPKKYFQELSRNTDHRKLDDTLRLVLDVTEDQLDRLISYLEQAYQQGRLVFGTHVSDSALMTCFVSDLGASRHLHFIDGSDGGLSVAATDFRRRMDERQHEAIAL